MNGQVNRSVDDYRSTTASRPTMVTTTMEPGSSQIRSALIMSGTFRTRWMYVRYLAWRGLQVRDVSTAAAAHDFRQVAEDAAERVETAG
jgi:hypothetical protein